MDSRGHNEMNAPVRLMNASRPRGDEGLQHSYLQLEEARREWLRHGVS